MVILTPITINNHFNNANYVTKVDHLCSERHTFNFLLKKVDFRGCHGNKLKMYGLYQLRLIIKQVCPTIQFVYGNLSKKDIRYICGRNEQLFVMYPDHRHRTRDNKVPTVVEWNGMSYQKLPLKDYLTERSF